MFIDLHPVKVAVHVSYLEKVAGKRKPPPPAQAPAGFDVRPVDPMTSVPKKGRGGIADLIASSRQELAPPPAPEQTAGVVGGKKAPPVTEVPVAKKPLPPAVPPVAPAAAAPASQSWHAGIPAALKTPRALGVAGLSAATIAAGLLGLGMDSGARRRKERRYYDR